MQTLLVLASLVCGAVVAWYAMRRGWIVVGRREGCYLLVYDGVHWRMSPAEDRPDGCQAEGMHYPLGVVQPIQRGELTLYLLAMQPVALGSFERVAAAVPQVIRGRMWRSGGDLVDMARLAGAVVTVVIALFLTAQILDMGSKLVSVQADAQTTRQIVTDVLSRPLRIAPVPVEPQP